MKFLKPVARLYVVMFGGVVLGVAGCRTASTSEGQIAKTTPPSMVSPQVVASNVNLGSELTRALSREPKLKGSNVIVSISNLDKTIYLVGNVQQPVQEKLALQIARKHNPAFKVVSQLVITSKTTFKK